jgi:hypothetical protein
MRGWGAVLVLGWQLACASPARAPRATSPAVAATPPSARPPQPVVLEPPPLVAQPAEPRFPADDEPAFERPRAREPVPFVCERGERPKTTSPLDAVCPGGARGSCKTCPSYTGFAESGSMSGTLELLAKGNFTGQGPELLVKLVGCEAHAQNWGGTVLVRQEQAGWAAIWYQPGFVPQECLLRAASDGHQLLACLENYGYNGPTYDTTATVIDLKQERIHQLYTSMCEDGRDLVKVKWGTKPDLDVLLTVRQVKKARSDEMGCPPDQGPERFLKIGYVLQNGDYAPNAQGATLLRSLVPTQDVDPSVRAAALSSHAPLPADVRPASSKPFSATPLDPCL